MVATVQLHDELVAHTDTIDNVFSNGLLSSKFVTSQLLITQMIPKEAFYICYVLAKLLGKFKIVLGVLAFYIPPTGSTASFALVLPTPSKRGGVMRSLWIKQVSLIL